MGNNGEPHWSYALTHTRHVGTGTRFHSEPRGWVPFFTILFGSTKREPFGHSANESSSANRKCPAWKHDSVTSDASSVSLSVPSITLQSRQAYPPAWFALIAHATSAVCPFRHRAGATSPTCGKNAPSNPIGIPKGGTPPLANESVGCPPATPHPLPNTGAVPGALHGCVRHTSYLPPTTSGSMLRAVWGSVPGPGISTLLLK